GVKIRDIKEIVIVEYAHCHALVNRAGGAVVARFERLGVIEVGIPARNYSVFTDENKLGRGRAHPAADTKEGRVVPHSTRWVRALHVDHAPRNHNDAGVREVWRRGAILIILGRSSSPVVDNEYRL